MSIPFLAALPMLATTAVGVAKVNAQGQAITKVDTGAITFLVTRYEMTTMLSKIVQTIWHSDQLSFQLAPCSIGPLLISLMICAKVVSSPTFSTLISKAPNSIKVPVSTWQLTVFSTGIDSPVIDA